MNVSKETAGAIFAVYRKIGFDIPEDCDAEGIIEMCIDADRLVMFGYPEAEAEVNAMIDKVGYPKALELLAAQVL